MARQRTTCSRCGERLVAAHNWTIDPCAMEGKTLHGRLCHRCDVDLNDLILSFFRVPGRKAAMEKYRNDPLYSEENIR